MASRSVLKTVVLVIALLGASVAHAQPEGALVIGTKEAPPFAMKDAGGQWTGLSIELWEEIALKLGLTYEIREFDLQGLLDAVESGEVDAGVAALTATGERELVVDFTHPFYTTGFGIAVAPLQRAGFLSSIRRVVSGRFLRWLGTLALVLFVVGGLVWVFERRANPEQFGSGVSGLWAGFWWAAVTMTTVGYGDKAPKSIMGRLLALVWMFTAIALLGVFIAAMTSALTVSQLESPIRGPEDLGRARVATVARSTSEDYLRENRVPHQVFPTLLEALKGISGGRVDAVVYDAPLLQYLVATNEMAGRAEVLPRTFERQDYCIALPTGSDLREPINRILLADSTRMLWQDILYRYLQQAPAPPPRPED